nr:MAG TPA: hypothetical protein [Caudoviricetes sp.]
MTKMNTTHLVPPGTRMSLGEYEALKAKKYKTDQDYYAMQWFEESYFNKSANLAAEFKTNQLPKLMDEYASYIESPAAIQAIYAKVNKLAYRKGDLVTADGWPHRNHTVTVNGIDFEFHTGTALNYSRAECIFNTIDSVLHDSMDAENYTLEKFLEEFGYVGQGSSGESALKGIGIYRATKEQRKKALQIWSADEIEIYCKNVNL